jgi:hypothetical protein
MIWQLLVCSVSIATNVFGLGAVERQPVRWENCAKPVLPAGTVNLVGCLIGILKKSF